MAIRVPAELVERDPAVVAPAAGLVYLSDTEPGVARRRTRDGFDYVVAESGTPVDGFDAERIDALAIPPAWEHVWICPVADGYLQASGIDEAGRKQYRYHDDFRAFCDDRKFRRLGYFARAIVLLRKAATDRLQAPVGSRDHAIAAAIQLIDRGLLRIGNDQSAAHGHHGATTLRVDHVVDDGFVTLQYTAKGGSDRHIVIEDDDLADVLVTLAADADDELFWFADAADAGGLDGDRRRATATDINRFIVEIAGPAFTAKDFRTWGGSCAALHARATGSSRLDAVDVAATELGNTRAVARSSYVHPVVLDSDEEAVEAAWSSSRSSRWMDRSESALAKLLAC